MVTVRNPAHATSAEPWALYLLDADGREIAGALGSRFMLDEQMSAENATFACDEPWMDCRGQPTDVLPSSRHQRHF